MATSPTALHRAALDFQRQHISDYPDGFFGGTTTWRTQVAEILNTEVAMQGSNWVEPFSTVRDQCTIKP